jgi:8-oxo-dGTP pyrophosphatase MutT (NUDIX family)
VLLYDRDDRLFLPLTQRAQTLQTHGGQISLPGGAREPQDKSFSETAVREVSEELGVPAEAISVLGPLTPLYVPPSRFCVYPYVGRALCPFSMRPDPDEVAEVIEVPLDHLLDPGSKGVRTRTRDGRRYEVPLYKLADHQVWGATAMILAEFLAMVRAALVP